MKYSIFIHVCISLKGFVVSKEARMWITKVLRGDILRSGRSWRRVNHNYNILYEKKYFLEMIKHGKKKRKNMLKK